MQCGLQVLHDVVVIRIFRSADHTIGETFEKAADVALRLDNRKVFIDFTQVESMDSLGLMMCAYGFHHLQRLQIPVALIRPPASLLPVLQEHGMQNVPSVFENVHDARQLN